MLRPDGRASARKSFVLLVMGTVMFFLCSVASADVPDSINYQGKLTTASGGCLNETVQMTFTIYADAFGTVLEWSETQTQVEVKEGIFNVLLGSVNPLAASIFDGSAKYLGVRVESDPEMSPLKPMVTTAYAFGSHHAQEADTADYARVAPVASDGDWQFSGGDIYRLEGRVGIGTIPSLCKLEVVGAAPSQWAPLVRIENTSPASSFSNGLLVKGGDNASDAYILAVADASNYFDFCVKGNGNVGIGTMSPDVKLHVEGEAMSVIASDTFYMVPKRGIIMWSGLLSEIPVGWALCNGTNGTPDLRDRFIYGCSEGVDPGATGGSTSHNHSVDIAPFASAGDGACWWSSTLVGGTCQPN